MDEDFVRVPFYEEANGAKTLFLPDVRMAKGFQIGAKGSERYISDYWDALNELMKMPTPRFRRRNKNNIPGIVACKPGNVDEVKCSYIKDLINQNT